ncbi:MAG TPA: MBG domain-containing protein, partial [Vicinamibacterales bacterium]|nr:MBG domain-containing protein [Vicinamibacterales bacterium]
FTITKAASTTTVTCAPTSVTYTGTAHQVCTASVTGAGGLTTTAAVSYDDNVNAGTVTASAAYDGDGNHDGSSDTATFEIAKAPSTTVVSCSGDQVYTGSAVETCSVSVTGDGGLNEAPAATYANNVSVGTATASYSYAGDANHEPSSDSEAFSITKKSAIVTPMAAGKTYGEADPSLTGTITGFVPTDNVTAVYSRNAGEAAGDYTISATLSPAAVLSNYDITYDTAVFTIGKAVLTVKAGNQAKLLGAPDPALTYTVTGLQFSDTAAGVLSGALTRDPGEAVGSYTIRQGALAPNANYTVSFTTGTLTVGYGTCLLYDPTKPVKSGAGIPLKIRLCSASGANVSASNIVVAAVSLQMISTSTSSQVEDAGNSNADSNFRFDPTLGPGYIFNLKTTGLPEGTYRLEIRMTGDPSPSYVTFQVRQ